MLFTGSVVICDPPVKDTDIDIVFEYDAATSWKLQNEDGFVVSDHAEYPNNNIKACYRKGNINLIAVDDTFTLRLWEKATRLARIMNLKEKHQRVILFQFITEGMVRNTGITYALPKPKQEASYEQVDLG